MDERKVEEKCGDGDSEEMFSSRAKYRKRMVGYNGIHSLFIPVHNPLKLNRDFLYQQV